MQPYYEACIQTLTFPFVLTINTGRSPYSHHWHDEWELVRILNDTVRVDVEGRVHVLVPDDLLLLPSGMRHCFYPAGPRAKRLAMKFLPELLLPKAAVLPARLNPFSFMWPVEAAGQIRAAADAIYDESATSRPGFELEICAQICKILSTAVRELPLPEQQMELSGKGEIAQVLQFLSEHYREDLTLNDCAMAIGYNPSYLSRVFYQKTGVFFHSYLKSLRIRQACWLLLHTDERITAIAEQAGFQSIKTFNRTFRDTQGCSPSEYRLRGA